MIFFVYDYLMRRQSSEQALILDLKRRFVRFISHEIRTPLNTVCMGLELLENDIKSHSRRILYGKNPGSHNDSSTSFSDHDLTSDVTAADVEAWYEITHDIQENASSAVMILNDLLNYDKIENGTLQLEVGDVEIISLVEKNVHKFQLQATNKKITLSFRVNACRCGTFQEYHPGNGSALFQPRNAVVFGDEMRLGQVVGNLISNAIKFTPSGGNIEVWMDHLSPPDCAPSRQSNEQLKDHVVSSDRERRGSVVISVKDSGAGMTQDQLALMFSEGIQFDRNKLQAGGGSGLGLCISKGIVDRHDGYIRAFSDGPGLGSTFTVELPFYANDIEFQSEDEGSVASSSCPHTEKTGSATTQNTVYESMKVCATALTSEANLSPICPNFSSQAHEQQLQPRHILVVEDVPSSQKMLVRLLQRAGHTCEVAWNGREAVDLVKASMKTHDNFDVEEGNVAQTFDTILMDFEMPLMNGPDATEEIRKLGFQNLIVGVTGNVLDEDVKHFVSKGADTVLGKPVGMARLNEVFASPHLHHRASTSLNRAMLAKLDSVDISTTKKRSP
jgi:signal transduction histidine kinase/CheY-like chemotaxis protein